MTSLMAPGVQADNAPDQGLTTPSADNVHCLLHSLCRNDGVIYDKDSLQTGPNRGIAYGLRVEGRVVDLECFGTGDSRRPAVGGVRGHVREFSWASRRRLLKVLGRLSWASLGQVWFVTLTYPPGSLFDGPKYKRHLWALRRRIEAEYGEFHAVWKMEFQWRTRPGVPHFHLLVRIPGAGLENGPDVSLFRLQLSRWWYEIVASGNLAHLDVGTNVEVARTDCARYFAYSLKEKGFQDKVPDWLYRPGRIWGVWRKGADPRGVLLSQAEWIELRRTLRKWQRSRGMKSSRRGRFSGEWYLSEPGSWAADVLTGDRGLLRALDRGDELRSVLA